MKVAPSDNAKRLRAEPTDAESILWSALRNRQLHGFKFRRQVPRNKYIVDFLCAKAKLIIEVDGGQHASRTEEDDVRTRHLERDGYRVLRFWNNEVLTNIEGVLQVIEAALINKGPLTPTLSPGGRGSLRSAPSPLRGEGQGEGGALSIRRARKTSPTFVKVEKAVDGKECGRASCDETVENTQLDALSRREEKSEGGDSVPSPRRVEGQGERASL